MIAFGFLMLLFPKLHVVRHKRHISFGAGPMSEGQANSYRVGCFLMAVGYWLTFR